MGIQRIQWRLHLWVLIGGALLIGTAVAAFYVLGTFVTPTSDDPPRKWDVVVLALTVAAGVGGLVALVVNYRKQLDLEEGRFSERFGAAAAQLGHPDVAVRIAGVYAMAGAADRTTRGQRQQCIDVLCGYLRLPYEPEIGSNHQTSKTTRRAFHNPAVPVEEETFQYRQNDREVRQTIVRVIASRLVRKTRPSWSKNDYDFTGALLEDAKFVGARFKGRTALFKGANFTGTSTSFQEATFSGALTSFSGATFSSVENSFRGATFSGALTSFDRATFSGALTSFDGATFSGEYSSFAGATFSEAITSSFSWATFSGANTVFSGATFSGALTSFDGATFSGAYTSFARATFSAVETSFEWAIFSGEETLFKEATFEQGGLITFESPRRWDPAPVFDWDDPETEVDIPASIRPWLWPPEPMTTFDAHLPKHRFAAVIRRIRTGAAKSANRIMRR